MSQIMLGCVRVCACVVKAWNGKCCSPSPGSLSRASVRKRQQATERENTEMARGDNNMT